MRLRNISLLFTFTLIALIAPVAAAQGERGRPWQFYWENDIGVFTEGTDQYYTNGLRLSIGLKEDEEPQRVRDFRDWYCRRRFQPCRRMESGDGIVVESLAFALTHQFWTPQVKTIAAPQPLDRPWAGYMYVSAIVQIVDDTVEKEQHLIEAQVGILGPGAGAAYVQTKWHELINSAKPLGWSNQLENEPVLNLVYVQNRRVWTRGDNTDLIVSPGGILGTLFTYPSLGFTARAGWNISGFPAMPLAPSAAALERDDRKSWEFYFHGGADARWVLHNATLDGGLLRDGPSVDRSDFVHDLRGGFSLRIFRNFRVTYTLVRRSEEFTPPPGRDGGPHNYNVLFVAWEPQR